MKTLPRPNRRLLAMAQRTFLCGLAVLIGIGFPASLRAEIILDLTFNDPNQLIKAHPEGVVEIPPEFSQSTATVTTGQGGKALPQINPGPPEERKEGTEETKLQILTDTETKNDFLQLTLTGNPVTRNIGVGISPDGLESSLSALIREENGLIFIDGGFDYFFRIAAEGTNPKIGLWTRIGPLGINVTSSPTEAELLLKVFTKKRSIDTDGDKKGDKTGIHTNSFGEVYLESNTVYHMAVVFRTTPEGLIAMNVCLQRGTGPMALADCVVASIENFWLLADGSPLEADKISISLDRTEFRQTLDMIAFRIFRPLPATLPGLDGKM